MPGFSTQSLPEVKLDVDQVVRLDFALKGIRSSLATELQGVHAFNLNDREICAP